MDKNQKFLKRLNRKELAAIQAILIKIRSNDTSQLDIKKLTGHTDVYRVRSGDIRIIFLANRLGIEILEVGRRNEKTYYNF